MGQKSKEETLTAELSLILSEYSKVEDMIRGICSFCYDADGLEELIDFIKTNKDDGLTLKDIFYESILIHQSKDPDVEYEDE